MSIRKLTPIAQYLTLGMNVETERTKFRGTVEEIREYRDERYYRIKWPSYSAESSGWYSTTQVEKSILIA